jgi:hypothetical protein
MKRLVEETTDELARSLLEAGIEHRPPPGNKAQVIVALGAGGALGMFSSNAFAWLGTTAGKITAVGMAVGVAGAVWVAAPSAGEARSNAQGSGVEATAQLHGSEVDDSAAVNGNEAARAVPGEARPSALPAAALAQNDEGAGDVAPPGDEPPADVQASDAEAAGAPRATAAGERRARSWRHARGARKAGARKRPRKEKGVASKSSELRRDGPLPAADTPPAGGALDERSAEQADLDREVRLVDDMHSAARRNDREALGRFLERYRASFPDGQLKREVAEFAARLEHPDISVAR